MTSSHVSQPSTRKVCLLLDPGTAACGYGTSGHLREWVRRTTVPRVFSELPFSLLLSLSVYLYLSIYLSISHCSTASFGAFNSAAGRVTAHQGMVTCLDALDYILLSTSVDKRIVLWDVRAQQQLCEYVVDSAVLKAALGPSSQYAAVSTVQGLHLVDFATMTSVSAGPFKERRTAGKYHDLKWNGQRTSLYAAGEDMHIDQFAVQY